MLTKISAGCSTLCVRACAQVVSRQYLGAGGGLVISFWLVARSVLIFLGAPLLAAVLTRAVGVPLIGRRVYDEKFAPRLGPIALFALLYTVWVMFALQGHQARERVSLPYLLWRMHAHCVDFHSQACIRGLRTCLACTHVVWPVSSFLLHGVPACSRAAAGMVNGVQKVPCKVAAQWALAAPYLRVSEICSTACR